tara:strand:+ start:43 stop:846 length:804 start_codon:yes stop_codon:yes gene_type:complete
MDFRNYDKCSESIKNLYKQQRTNQNLGYAKKMRKKYCQFTNKNYFWELFDMVQIKDVSDPDISLPNNYHLFQTAEGIRKANLPEWMQVVGLIHDLGKVLYKKNKNLQEAKIDGISEDTQWGLVGDTFILGHRIPNTAIFPEYNDLNQDHLKYKDSKYGSYQPNIGLNNVICSFGHDEYLYQMLKYNGIPLPEEGYYMIRFHSLYLWHKENEYGHLEDEKDREMKSWVQKFNQFDLYTKDDNGKMEIEELKHYYDKLIHKYFPEEIFW